MEDGVKVNFDILVDLDTLFDTRLPILYAIDKDSVLPMLEDGTYYTRDIDEIGDIAYDVFKGYYKNRDKRVLLISQPTPMVGLVSEYIMKSSQQKLVTGDAGPITLYINTYPYDLEDGEIDSIKDDLSGIAPDVNIVMTSKSIEELQPVWVESNLGAVIKYDGIEWLDYHIADGSLTKTPILDTVLLCPYLSYSRNDDKDKKEIYDVILESMNTLIGLSFIKMEFYCISKEE